MSQVCDPPFVTVADPVSDAATAIFGKGMGLGLGTKFATVTVTAVLLPPPPQDIDHRAMAKQDTARMIAILRS